ncbi:MAG: DUF1015 family protein, partial [Acidimicrobiales bacterium]
ARDRLHLRRPIAANLSLVWWLSLPPGLPALLDVEHATGLGSWRDGDGVEHGLWRVDGGSAVAAIVKAIGSAPVVIADGHHRYATCGQYRAERRAAAGGAAGAYDSTLCYIVELVEEQLTVQPIHRLVSGLPAGIDLAEALAASFTVGALEPHPKATVIERLVAQSALALVTRDGLRTLTPIRGAFAGLRDLDSARLDHALEALPAHRLSYQHGVANVVAAVTAGEADCGVLLRPVSVEEIQSTAHARDKMPPKSTFFWPKPRTGAVFRSLG